MSEIHSSNGEILLLNHGDDSGLYNRQVAPVVTPEWTTLPTFIAPVPTEVGSVVFVDPGIFGPDGTVISIAIGTGLDDDFVPYIGNGGTIPAAMAGLPMTARPVLNKDGVLTATTIDSGVTISGVAEPEFPGYTLVPGEDFTAMELRDASIGVSGKRRFSVPSTTQQPPEGCEYRWYSGPIAAGVLEDAVTTPIAVGQTLDTNGQMLIGQDCYNHLFVKRFSDGKYERLHTAETAIHFVIRGLIIIDTGDTFPPADARLSSVSYTAIMSALNAVNGSKAKYIIDMPTGDYGAFTIADKTLPTKVVLRSENRNLGARVRAMTLRNVENLYFECVDFNRQGLGYTMKGVEVLASRKIGFSYGRFYMPEIIPRPDRGYERRARWGMFFDHVSGSRCQDILIHMNEFNGPMLTGVYFNASDRVEFSDNIQVNGGADLFYIGVGRDFDILRNWGSRLSYPGFDPNANGGVGELDHGDFVQIDSQAGISQRIRHRDNVLIAAKHPVLHQYTRQGLFASKSYCQDNEYIQNLIVTNCGQGVWCGPADRQSGHRVENNAVLRIIDMVSTHDGTYIAVGGSGTTLARNIEHNGSSSGRTGVLNIPINGTDYTGSRAYYGNPSAEIAPGVMSSFADMAPIAGKPTHWNYSAAAPIGPAEMFRQVIVEKRYPKSDRPQRLGKRGMIHEGKYHKLILVRGENRVDATKTYTLNTVSHGGKWHAD